MNKKHELVNQVLESLENAGVVQDSCESLRAKMSFWADSPQGHCNDLGSSVEGELSCLTEENLAAILALGAPPQGITYSALWKEWGKQGCLKCVPEILDPDMVPVLRIRHDSYLSWFRGYRFQNSYDAYGNGSNGESNSDLGRAVSLCNDFLSEDYVECLHEMSEEDLSACITALIMSYPAYACRGKQSFYKALQTHPTVFDEFLQRTNRLMRVRIKSFMPIEKLREQLSVPLGNCCINAEYPLVAEGAQIALLRLCRNAVELAWSENGEYHAYAIKFPFTPYGEDKDYTKFMWENLTTTLLTLAGFSATEYKIQPVTTSKLNAVEPYFYPAGERVSGYRQLYRNIAELTK